MIKAVLGSQYQTNTGAKQAAASAANEDILKTNAMTSQVTSMDRATGSDIAKNTALNLHDYNQTNAGFRESSVH